MIEITKGNPTSEELAALDAALSICSSARPRVTNSTADGWRRSTPCAESTAHDPSPRGRRWRVTSAGWIRQFPST
jgi:hypothetical protein